MKKFRNNGAIGALLDEYEKSIEELKEVISKISIEQLVEIIDKQTTDEDCKSIQTILTHVISSGYNYVIAIRKWLGEDLGYKRKKPLSTVNDYQKALDEMFQYNVKLFEDHPDVEIEKYECSQKIKVRWGQYYDVEQLYEHAILHILRHRRQIERFLQN